MSNFPPDPGGVFASDYHRRVAAHLPLPSDDAITVDELLQRLDADAHTGLSYRDEDRDPLVRILDDLQETGEAKYLDGSAGWRMTKAGLGRLSGPALTDVQEVDGELVRVEPAPLEGPKLKEAEEQTKRIEAEDAEIEERAKSNAVEVAEQQLAEAKKAAGVS